MSDRYEQLRAEIDAEIAKLRGSSAPETPANPADYDDHSDRAELAAQVAQAAQQAVAQVQAPPKPSPIPRALQRPNTVAPPPTPAPERNGQLVLATGQAPVRIPGTNVAVSVGIEVGGDQPAVRLLWRVVA
ncbi:hypothetical protein LQ327_08855 [Actinomycetospora endophytica]|uniref:Uncharacterized protein n=1 Tax=Actinomycetospora endophytica TaxID=2291215 RepID=A0ABS8P7H3_9PSEU|nr:hypothetical protein [Actinomycetospora endophytica]MCD2193490.1 hypothetical protein [Actinomycetospora endophytica]